MLPAIPLIFLILEVTICTTLGMHFMNELLTRRLGEFTLLIVLWITLMRLLAVGCSFLFALNRNKPTHEQSRAEFFKMLMKETLSVFFAFSIFIPLKRLFAPTLKASVPTNKTIVLLVHGLISNSGIWWLFARRLAKSGIVFVHSIDLGPPFQSIDSAALVLNKTLNQLEALKPTKIVIVGHSMGGLVARSCLLAKGRPLVSEIITIGTPHQGSLTANALPLANLRQMRPNSEWLLQLRASEKRAVSKLTPVIALYSTHDNLVVPYTSGSHIGSQSLEVQHLGHLSLLFDSSICATVVSMIRDPKDAHLH